LVVHEIRCPNLVPFSNAAHAKVIDIRFSAVGLAVISRWAELYPLREISTFGG